jgi:uncharacterized RDD family membrane protein YckC
MPPADANPGTALTPEKPGRVRSLITPEGVDLHLVLADAGERLAAFLLDAAIIIGSLVAATIVILLLAAAMAAQGASMQILGILWLFVFFGLRNAYFIAFELTPRAATPGKRALGLRVASRDGGPLSADAVFARNALREIEVYLPLTFLVTQRTGVDGWIVLAGLTWSGVFALFLLFNRDRLRAGDLVAGTWVVRSPKRRLLPDLTGDGATDRAGFAFTSAQINAYGVKELHVLEDVIRKGDPRVTSEVSARIRRKISWIGSEPDREFLGAYYTALRGRLETRLLFGHRRKDKFDI